MTKSVFIINRADENRCTKWCRDNDVTVLDVLYTPWSSTWTCNLNNEQEFLLRIAFKLVRPAEAPHKYLRDRD